MTVRNKAVLSKLAYGVEVDPLLVEPREEVKLSINSTKVSVEKLTGISLTREAIEHCCPNINNSRITLETLYKREESIMRLQLFKVKFYDVPSFVATHLVRHATVGQFWYIESRRDDWDTRDDRSDREAPVNIFAVLNAQHLVTMARARLCGKAHLSARIVMCSLRGAVSKVDMALAAEMVPDCFYRGGVCHKHKPCGLVHQYRGGDATQCTL